MRIRWQYMPLSTVRRWSSTISELEHRVAALLRPFSLPWLRFSRVLIFIWFGSLRAAKVPRGGALGAGTVPGVAAAWFVPAVGVVEVLGGFALIANGRAHV